MIEFLKKHKILLHLLIMLFIALSLITVASLLMKKYTQHGVSVMVPDIKQLTVEEAAPILKRQGLECQVIDSIYESKLRPGAIVEQTPREGTTIKQKRAVYVIINSLYPRRIELPALKDVSCRQAVSMIESLGFPTPQIKYVPSVYKDLVIDVQKNGRKVKEGEKCYITTCFTLIVGGDEEEPEIPSFNVE